jgi:hypothetical protein
MLSLSVTLFALAGSGPCVTIQNRNPCTANGTLALGATCAETETAQTSQLTFDQYVAFLEAAPNKPPAICQSGADYVTESTELETLCREQGSFCSYQLKQEVAQRNQIIKIFNLQ